jgi:hypothetical protein
MNSCSLLVHVCIDVQAQLAVDDPDEAPRLHEADAGFLMGCPDETCQLFRIDGRCQEMARYTPSLSVGAKALGYMTNGLGMACSVKAVEGGGQDVAPRQCCSSYDTNHC